MVVIGSISGLCGNVFDCFELYNSIILFYVAIYSFVYNILYIHTILILAILTTTASPRETLKNQGMC